VLIVVCQTFFLNIFFYNLISPGFDPLPDGEVH
jgi:hypothetical protein